MTRSAIRMLAVAAALTAALLPPVPASGAFPGGNGDLAFVASDGDLEIHRISAAGVGHVQLTDNDRDDVDPAWSPDGRLLAYAAFQNGSSHLRIMHEDGRRDGRVTSPGPMYDRQPAWSPSGDHLAFVRSARAGWSRIYSVAADGTGLTRLTGTGKDVRNTGPAWSPDGATIAFASDREGGLPQIWTMSPDGTRQRRLVTSAFFDTNPAWSPDGTMLAFERCCPGGDADVVVVAADGSGEAVVAGGPENAADPAWSPDGTSIAIVTFPAEGGSPELAWVPAAGGIATPIPATPVSEVAPDWQPLTSCDIEGGPGDDVLVGTALGETICGFAGDDLLQGGGGPDILIGGVGDDVLEGGSGKDTLLGGPGSDQLDGGAGDDTADGGPGSDLAAFGSALAGVDANLTTGTATGAGVGADVLMGIEDLDGTPFDDRLTGDAAGNVLRGGEGDDRLFAEDGDDVLEGGPGDDRLVGRAGSDTAGYGGAGSGVTVRLGTNDPQNTGGAGEDILFGIEHLSGSPHADRLIGNRYVNRLSGGGSADVLIGGGRNDVLHGSWGADDLRGGAGDDTIVGGKGRDDMAGGAGDDWFDAKDGTTDRVNGGNGADDGRFDGKDILRSIEGSGGGGGGGSGGGGTGRITQRSSRLMPGLKLLKIRHRRGPTRVFALRVEPRKRPRVDLALAQDRLQGRERTSSMARRHRAIAAVNGDFSRPGGRPLHPFAEDATLHQMSRTTAPSFVVARNERRAYARYGNLAAFLDRGAAGDRLRIDRWNEGEPLAGETSAVTPSGATIEFPPAGACAARLLPVGPYGWTEPGVGRVHVVDKAGCSADPIGRGAGIAVATPPGMLEAHLVQSLPAGAEVTVGWTPGWNGVVERIGGFPQLLRGGKIKVSRCAEYLCRRHPRTAVGIMKDGTILIVVVDGRRSGWSSGMTLVELAREMRRLGAVEAVNLDGGGSSTMVVKGRVVNRPTDPDGERDVSSAVLVLRGGDEGEAGFGGPLGPAWASASVPPSPRGGGDRASLLDPASTGGVLEAIDRGLFGARGELSPELRSLLEEFRAAR